MSAEVLLNNLHKVRKNGAGKWMACCPAHDDRSPSLAVTEGVDGHILIHCFAGCSAQEVMESVGLRMSDLMPERDAHYFDDYPPILRPRETKQESDLAHIQIRFLTAEAMAEGGQKLTQAEKKQAISDYKYLRKIGKLP